MRHFRSTELFLEIFRHERNRIGDTWSQTLTRNHIQLQNLLEFVPEPRKLLGGDPPSCGESSGVIGIVARLLTDRM